MPSLRSRIAGWVLGVDPDTAQRVVEMDSTSPKVLKRRLDDLAETVDWLGGQIARLRGRVVGGVRRGSTSEPELVVIGEDDPEPDPDLFEEVTEQYTRKELGNGGSQRAPNHEVQGVP